eukprot:CAMPEP_0117436276 /NCGR_PEP_ID=MMETSP0759-20121206/922_1 /TAXON_ID=63605 /ORGANISM="Percolomonas cosmopolitus, Strain WS" /LENGTH=966 /DNA_ID=CAMNT_0005227867 /DNA_START=239 /DNA_END=3140 /DNA_ORIENTATION=+
MPLRAPSFLSPEEAKCLSPENVADIFQTNISSGLTDHQVDKLQAEYGRNELHEDDEESLFSKFLDQFKEPNDFDVVGSAIVSCLVGAFSDAISIILAVLIVCSVAFVQEYRSDQALDALKDLVTYHAKVVRNGHVQNINAAELCVGDLIEINTGDRIPADVRIVDQVQLTINESLFTGEGEPAKKIVEAVSDNEPLMPSSRKATDVSGCPNIAFQGSLTSSGNARGIVIATSHNTELGKIHSILKSLEEGQTPLQESMDKLAKHISILSFGIIIVIFLIGILTNKSWLEMFTMGISLAVAAIPEGLPIVVTVTLAMGVTRMAKKNVIIRKLPSVEALGAVNVVCVDKTGTLTQNEMTVTSIYTPGTPSEHSDTYVQVTGVGYLPRDGGLYRRPVQDFSSNSKHSQTRVNVEQPGQESLRMLLSIGAVCNNSTITHDGQLVGVPTEGALVAVAQKAGLTREKEIWNRVAEIPFNSTEKWMAVEVQNNMKGSRPVYFMKGATETVLDKCSRYYMNDENIRPLTDDVRERITRVSDKFADSSLRVMALAFGPSLNTARNGEPATADDDMIFVGIVGIYDPPRPGVDKSIEQLLSAKVKVVMITGDSRKTALAIARELKMIPDENQHQSALDIGSPRTARAAQANKNRNFADPDDHHAMGPRDLLHVEDFRERLSDVCVFYRMSPLHKMKIVQAFKDEGYIVAMTGDGVNDAPALKLSNIGIAMGRSGTDVSKESSDMILVDDNFSSIEAAIEEGKSIFNNIKNFLRYQLTTSVSCIGIIIYCTIFGYPLPLNPMQILWINIIMDGPPAQSLGVEPVDEEVMKCPPRDTKKPIISSRMIFSVLLNAVVMMIGTLYVFTSEMEEDGIVNSRDTSMVFTTFVMYQVFNALNCRSENRSVFSLGLFKNTAFLVAVGGSVLGQLAMIYLPFMQFIFETEALSVGDWGLILSLTSTVFVLEEVIKFFGRFSEKKD